MSDLKGVEIHDLLGLSEPLKKLVETVSNGVGKIYEPRHIRKLAKAKADEISIISDAVNRNLSLPTSYANGSVTIDTTDANNLVQRAQNRFLFQEMKKQQNIESVIGQAYNELECADSVSSTPVDDDWISIFFDSVANVSNAQMQLIWGKILSGEIKKPESFSRRTLECVKNLSQNEAVNFQKFLSYAITSSRGYIVLYDATLLSDVGVSYVDILSLEELGLLQTKTGLSISFDVGKIPATINNDEYKITLFSSDELTHHVSLKILSLTSIGNELASVFKSELNLEYLKSFLIKAQGTHQFQNIKVRLNQLVIDEPATIRFKDLLTEE